LRIAKIRIASLPALSKGERARIIFEIDFKPSPLERVWVRLLCGTIINCTV
jgi:hypothetical protein